MESWNASKNFKKVTVRCTMSAMIAITTAKVQKEERHIKKVMEGHHHKT